MASLPFLLPCVTWLYYFTAVNPRWKATRQASRPLSCLPAQSPTRWPWPPPRGYGGHGHPPSPLLRRTCLFLAQLTRRCPLPHGHCPNANLFTCCNNHKFSVGDEGVSLTHAMAEGLAMARNRKVAVAIIAIASSIHWRWVETKKKKNTLPLRGPNSSMSSHLRHTSNPSFWCSFPPRLPRRSCILRRAREAEAVWLAADVTWLDLIRFHMDCGGCLDRAQVV